MIKRIKVEVVADLYLPRFRALIGFNWEVRVDRLQKDGFSLGGGFVKNEDYKVIGVI